MEHLSQEKYLELITMLEKHKYSKKKYLRYYKIICQTWRTPEDWFDSNNKTIYLSNEYTTNNYWILWSLENKSKLPDEFIKEINIKRSKKILKNTLKDYKNLEETYFELRKVYSAVHLNKIYSGVLNICLYKGLNSIKDILVEDIINAEKQGIIGKSAYKIVIAKFIYYMGYIDKPIEDSILHEGINNRKIKISNIWSPEMKKIIERFIQNLWNSSISSKTTEREKVSDLNYFGEWIIKNKFMLQIDNLLNLNRSTWLRYVEHIKKRADISDKTKGRYIRDIKQFIEWAQVKEPKILIEDYIVSKSDLKNLNENNYDTSLAFEKRLYGEKILNYLVNEFNPQSVKEKYIKEAIIIASNSGMRISEIRNLKYKSAFYSEDEELYKVLLEYSDKLGQRNRPIYITKDGYDSICRVEKLREQNGILKEKYNNRTKKKYIHLFEYRSKSSINSTIIYEFLEKIKTDIGLIDENNKVVKGGLHAFRHMFGMTLFRESGYNISVVRYLLGHRRYQMTYNYLEEEKGSLIEQIRSSEVSEEFSGKGIETLLEIILNNKKVDNKNILNIMESKYNLSSLIEFKKIKKVSFGYCLNPCNNSERCIRCKYFFIAKKDKDNLIKSIIELFELICIKKRIMTNKPGSKKNNLEDDILNLEILISEVTNFGLKKEAIYNMLKGGDMSVNIY